MTVKEELHQLVDSLPENELPVARRFLEFLADLSCDPVLRALHEAPIDDEPLPPEEAAESDAAWKAYLEGKDKGKPLERLRRELP